MGAVPDYQPVLAALVVLQSNAQSSQKTEAHKSLEEFQKSQQAWTVTNYILNDPNAAVEPKLFAATTLKGKIVYDLDQLPRSQLPGLRDTLLGLLSTYSNGPKPIRTQLCVCLVNLAIQMTEWKNVLQLVGSTLGASSGDTVLDFLRILPEEVIEGRKINLSEEDLTARTKELLEDNAQQVLALLINYAASSPTASSNPHLLDCIASWTREIPAAQIVQSPLLGSIIDALGVDASFEAAVDCMCTLYHETTDVDESKDVIQILYPRLLSLRPLIASVAGEDDAEKYKSTTRLFTEAGEAWVVLTARLPNEFRSLVEAILECCARDADRDAISITFRFWGELKQHITVPAHASAQEHYQDIFGQLVDVMVRHLEFPTLSDPNATDLFDGDREQEENFRSFRHRMGDVLKDCCEVIGASTCLHKAYDLIKSWVATYASQVNGSVVPHWQKLEAPLFAIRGMGRMVSPEEETVLPDLISLMVQIPEHEKLRFQAVMALGRYTEWTANHPDYLQPQLQYLISSFQHPNSEVKEAAALAFSFFGQDCSRLLVNEIHPFHTFYDGVLDALIPSSQEELTKGVSFIIGSQSKDKIYASMKLYCDPLVERLKRRANEAQSDPENKILKERVAETIILLTIFINNVTPYYEPNELNQAVKYCEELLPVLAAISSAFKNSLPILETVCRCWRTMVLSYRVGVLPILEELATQLSAGFKESRQGCFLWATGAVLREFSEDVEYVDPATTKAVYNFFEQQAFAFLEIMNDLPPQELPDVIEDFFLLIEDALICYHDQFIPSAISTPIFTAACSALVLEQERPVTKVLRYLEDLLSYGTSHPHSSQLSHQSTPAAQAKNRSSILSLASSQGETLVQRLLDGMMFTFPRDCLHDAANVALLLFELDARQTALWVKATLDLLPESNFKAGEREKLLTAVQEKLQTGQTFKIRTVLQDFTTSYRRRHVAPRDGLRPLLPGNKR